MSEIYESYQINNNNYLKNKKNRYQIIINAIKA